MIDLASLYPTINRQKVLKHNPTLIGVVNGIKFFEHPVHGDEVGLIAITETEAFQTDWYDLPELCDLI